LAAVYPRCYSPVDRGSDEVIVEAVPVDIGELNLRAIGSIDPICDLDRDRPRPAGAVSRRAAVEVSGDGAVRKDVQVVGLAVPVDVRELNLAARPPTPLAMGG